MGTERARRVFIPIVLTVATLLGVLEVTAERGTHPSPRPEPPSWSTSLQEMDAAIARGDLMAAASSRHQVYRAAISVRSWEAFLAAGDGSLRLGEATQSRSAAEHEARRLYLAALFRARSQYSLDGLLRATEAFVRLGDHDMVAQGLSMARELAGSDPESQARVREVAHRSAHEAVAAGERDAEGL
jgi:hypothetical protein